jgi:hypothetical protein
MAREFEAGWNLIEALGRGLAERELFAGRAFWIVWIYEEGDDCRIGDQLVQQPQPLGSEFGVLRIFGNEAVHVRKNDARQPPEIERMLDFWLGWISSRESPSSQ